MQCVSPEVLCVMLWKFPWPNVLCSAIVRIPGRFLRSAIVTVPRWFLSLSVRSDNSSPHKPCQESKTASRQQRREAVPSSLTWERQWNDRQSQAPRRQQSQLVQVLGGPRREDGGRAVTTGVTSEMGGGLSSLSRERGRQTRWMPP